MERAEERSSKLEDRTIEIIQSEQQGENKFLKNEQSLRELWCYNRRGNIPVIRGVLNGEEKEGGAEKLLREITVEKFPNLAKEKSTVLRS